LDSSVGPIAGLIDIACLYGTAEFAIIQGDIFIVWNSETFNDGTSPYELIYDFLYDFNIRLVGTHYFTNYNDTILPKFDFTTVGPTAGNTDAFVVGTIDGGIPAPDSAHDIDWIELMVVWGKFSDEVYCVETRGGQPPDSVSSVRLYLILLVQPFDLRSAFLGQIRSLSTMLRNTVSAHGLTISMWPLLTCAYRVRRWFTLKVAECTMRYVDAVGMNNRVRTARACGEPNIIETFAQFSL